MKPCENELQCGNMLGRMHINRNSSTIILYANNIIRLKRDCDIFTKTSHSLIYTVVNCFIDKVMETARTCRTDVHSRSFSYRFKSF